MSEKALIDALLCGRPYFGPAMRALQGPPERHKYLCAIAQTVARWTDGGHIRILEIGSWAGASAITWVTASESIGKKAFVTCVDPWTPYFDENVNIEPLYKEMNEAAGQGKIFKLFLHNIRAAHVSESIKYCVGSTSDILPAIPSGKFDIVYIDGSHVYESARTDIHEAKRIVRNGGVICGDDLELQKKEVDPTQHKSAVHFKKDYVYSEATDRSYHPGVTEAVAVEFGEVSAWDGVWAMKKARSEWARIKIDTNEMRVPEHIANAVPETEVVEEGQTRDFRLMRSNGKHAAVAKALSVRGLFVDLLGEQELWPVLLTGISSQEVRKKAVQIEEETRPVAQLVGETPEFNLVQVKGHFLAAAKSMGPIELLVERLGERDLPPLLFVGTTRDEVCEKANSVEKLHPQVRLLEQTGNYNLVQAGDIFVAIAKILGPVNLFRERLGARDLPPYILIAPDIMVLRQRVSEASEFPQNDGVTNS